MARAVFPALTGAMAVITVYFAWQHDLEGVASFSVLTLAMAGISALEWRKR